MHRAYQPLTPANNYYLRHRWDQSYYDAHRKKVVTAKPMVDNKPPKTYMHLHIKLKKLQMEEERLTTVERDNRILLQKMAYIMKYGGSVDNVKHDYMKKSLNKIKRQSELLRITHENMAILKRINAKEPHYNHLRWKRENQVNQQYMMNISKYPTQWKDQEHFEIHKMQQIAANQKIRERVNGRQDPTENYNAAESALNAIAKHRASMMAPKLTIETGSLYKM